MYPFFPKHLSIQAAIILLSNWDTVRLSRRIKVIELVSKKPFPETCGRVWAFWTPTIPDYLYGQKTNTALSFTNKLKYKNKLKKQRPVPCIMECLPAFPASTHWKPVTNHLSPPTHSPPSWQTKKKTYPNILSAGRQNSFPHTTSESHWHRIFTLLFSMMWKGFAKQLVWFIINYLLQDRKTKARKVGCPKSHCSK